MVVIDDDNWASADMWFHDFDDDGYPDLIANQIFSSTVTRYWHPGADLTDPWMPEIVISGLTSPSDMWLADMNSDGFMDVCSADHTAHRGFWHQNPGPGQPGPWKPNLIFRNIRLPGDFAMVDMESDGDSLFLYLTNIFFHILNFLPQLTILHVHNGDFFQVVNLLLLLILKNQCSIVPLISHSFKFSLEILETELILHGQVFLKNGILLGVVKVLIDTVVNLHDS